MNNCSCITNKNKPCPIPADRKIKNNWYCHVHDPEGTFQQQQQKNKGKKTTIKTTVNSSLELTPLQLLFVQHMLETFGEEEMKAMIRISDCEL